MIDICMTYKKNNYHLVPDGSGCCSACAFHDSRSITTCRFGWKPPEWNSCTVCSDLDGHWEIDK